MTPSRDVGPDGPLLTAAEACEQLRISKRTLSRWRRSHKIRSYRVGGRVKILQIDVDAALKAAEQV